MKNGVGLSRYLCVSNEALRKNPQKHNNCNWHKVSASILMMMLMMMMHNSNRLLASWLLSLREQCVGCWHTYTTIIPLPQHTNCKQQQQQKTSICWLLLLLPRFTKGDFLDPNSWSKIKSQSHPNSQIPIIPDLLILFFHEEWMDFLGSSNLLNTYLSFSPFIPFFLSF
jgi:hypothetical protein